MDTLLLVVVGFGFAVVGGYRLSRRVPILGSMAALVLLGVALVLMKSGALTTTLGDGAPSSAGAFLGLLWLIAMAAIVLAGVFLVAGWRAEDNPLPKVLLLFVFLPCVAWFLWLAFPDARPKTGPVQERPQATIQQGSRKDGYLWAIDSQFFSEADCRNGTEEFLAGCREGVAKNQLLHGK